MSLELERDLKKLKAIYDRVRRQVGTPTSTGPVVVFIPGCWDLFHIGHLNVIKRAAALGDHLVVGVVTSRFMRAYKGDEVIPFDQRRKVVGALRYVDATVPYEVDDFSVFDKYDVTIWVVGPEHGVYEFQKRVNRELKRRGVKCVVLPRTPNISTATIKERIRVTDPEEKSCGKERT